MRLFRYKLSNGGGSDANSIGIAPQLMKHRLSTNKGEISYNISITKGKADPQKAKAKVKINLKKSTAIVKTDSKISTGKEKSDPKRGSTVPTPEQNVQIQACANRRFIVYLCSKDFLCGGLGDRQRGILSTYVISVITNRTFVIIHQKPCSLTNYYRPNMYDWTQCQDYLLSVKKNNSNTFDFMSGHYKLNQTLDKINFDTFFPQKIVFIRTNFPNIRQLIFHDKAKQSFGWAKGKTEDEVKGRLLELLLKPTIKLDRDVTDFLANNTNGRQLVCGHIRVGRNPSIPLDSSRKPPLNISTMFMFLKRYSDISKYAVYIASDSEEVKVHAKTEIANSFMLDRPIIHIDRYSQNQTSLACDGMYTIIFEQAALSRCEVFIHTGGNIGRISATLNRNLKLGYLYDSEKNTIHNFKNSSFKIN